MKLLRCTVILIAVFINIQIHAKDIAGSADHPLVGRFSNAEILGYKQTNFDEYEFAEGEIVKNTNGRYVYAKSSIIEGKVTRIYYVAPAQNSVIEVTRNYQKQLSDNGFETVYECKGKEYTCGYSAKDMSNFNPELVEYAYLMTENRYITMRKKRTQGDVYVSLLVFNYSFDSYSFRNRHNHPIVQLDVIEAEALDDTQIEVISADKIVSEVNEQGRIAIYGIYFDSGKSAIKDQSIPSIEQIHEALQDSPALTLHVVGHTDNTGTFENNMVLARERANAVVTALITLGIDPNRLMANGVASLAPIASNGSEQGRAKNRRVELVAQ